MQKIGIHVLVSTVLVVSESNPSRVLVVRHKKIPKMLVIPGGKSEQGESCLDTAVRELREETGVHLSSSALIPLTTLIEVEDGVSYWNSVYYSECLDTFDPISAETALDPHWTTLDELTEHGAYSSFNREVLSAYFKLKGIPSSAKNIANLELTVTATIDLADESVQSVKESIKWALSSAIGNGLITGHSSAEVIEYSSDVLVS